MCWARALGIVLGLSCGIAGGFWLLGGGFAAHSSLSAVYPSTQGTAWENRACCSLLGSSSSSWKVPTSSPDIRPVAASVSRCHFGSASAGSSCSSAIPLGSPLRSHFPCSGFTRCLLVPHSLEPGALSHVHLLPFCSCASDWDG